MRYTGKSELLLKYQKTKAKLIEYDVPNDAYPNFPVNSNDLSFSTVYILSRYAESIIENDAKHQAEFRPYLEKAAQYYDAAFESKERLQHDQDFLITGAVAYFLHNDFGSAKVLCSKVSFDLPVVNTPFQLLVVCLRYLLASKTQRFESDISCCSNIYKSLLTYFRLGDDDGNTISWLCKYRQYTFNHGNALDDFYVDLLYVVVVFAMQKSAWSLLPQHSGITVDVWRSYLDRREAVKILWQSQELLCTHGVLRGNNAIVELPTGVGKTKSIELIIRAAQLSNRAREVIIVAPLRALCNEITHDLQCAFRKDDVEINRFSDVLEDDYSFDLLSNDSIRISICTPEKLNYIIHHQPEICDMVGLFVLDEAHMFDDGIRGITYEFLVTTIRERLNENQQLVLLSAVMTNADDIKRWLFGENGVLATDEKIVSTPKSVGFCNASNIAYYSGDPLTWDYFVPLDIVTHELQLFGRERKLRVFPQGHSSQDIALYYGIRLCRNGGVAVYVDKTASVRKTIERAVDIQKRGYSLNNIVDNSDISEMEKLQYLISKYYGKDHVYTVGCCNGILPHHSKLPNGVKLAVEHALREKMARFVICTSTLAQGVNIPIKYLLMTSVNQRNSHAKVRSFQNLIGRTARAGMYTEGSILITDPTLYERRNTYENGGKYRWHECCDMFSKLKAEPCQSSLLLLVSNLEIGYEGHIEAKRLVKYILEHYAEADCFNVLQEKIINAFASEQDQQIKESIIYQLSQRKQALDAVENYLCFVYGTPISLEQDIHENIGESICKDTLAYYLADEEEKGMLLSVFRVIEEKVAVLSERQRVKYSASMTAVDCGKAIEAWIDEIDLLNHFYTEMDMLQLVVSLYFSLYRTKLMEAELLRLCQQWIEGEMPLEMLKESSFTDIDQLMATCHETISYELSFLVGNIIDLLPESDDENIGSELYSNLSLLQRKLKYGVPNLTAISVCESLFWDRHIAIEIATMIRNESATSSDLDAYLLYNKDNILEYLENMPSYFTERFSTFINRKSGA